MDIGTTLRLARERVGLSREQISIATKVSLEKLDALEENDLERLPPGVYLDGIVRAYAHEVGLDPEPLLHPLQSSPEYVSASPSVSELAQAVEARDHTAAPSSRRRHGMALIALVALVLAAFAVGGYLSTSSRRPAPAQRTSAEADDRSVGTTGVSSAPGPEISSAQSGEPASPADGTNGDGDAGQRAAAARERDVTGAWTIDTRVDRSSVKAYRGLQLGYVLNLRQDGERVTGSGRKLTENGARLPAAAQTPIEVVGKVTGDQLNLTFTERGARRESTGTFVLKRNADGSLRGSFSSNAARSSGAAAAHRR